MSTGDKYLDFLKAQAKAKTQTPQMKPIPGRESEMIQNKAGGYGFKLETFQALRRSMLLGTTDNSYYAGKDELTKDFIDLINKAIKEDPVKTAQEIVWASDGRALNNSTPILALTLLSASSEKKAKEEFRKIFPKVVRTASHFYQWLAYTRSLRGMGRVVRMVGRDWLSSQHVDRLAYQFIKYGQRQGYAGRDVLRLFHLKPDSDERSMLFKYLTKGWEAIAASTLPESLKQIQVYEKLKNKEMSAVEAIKVGRLPHEAVSAFIGQDKEAWQAVFDHMPVGAMIRQLGSLTAKEVLNQASNTDKAYNLLTNSAIIRKARIHPMEVLKAMRVYRQGKGFKGKLTWSPIPHIVKALDLAFEASFEASTLPQDLVYKVYVDISGSMRSGSAQGSDDLFTPLEAAGAIALLVAKKVKHYEIVGFNRLDGHSWTSTHYNEWNGRMGNGLHKLNVFGNDSYNAAMQTLTSSPSGGTDCSLPFQHLLMKKEKVDVCIMLTDNESWAGGLHACQALDKYRKTVNPHIKMIYGTMQPGSNFTLTEPSDANSMDIAGFSPNAVKAMELFINGFEKMGMTEGSEIEGVEEAIA